MFGNPGTTELPLMDALAAEQELRYVLALQEAPAMGDGRRLCPGLRRAARWSTCTSRPGSATPWACCTTRRRPASPIMVTAGQHEQRFNFTEPLLWADLPTIARPFVKWSAEVRRLEDLPRAIHRAAKTALAPPTGPVFLSLPGDILTASADLDLGEPTPRGARLRGDAAAIAAGGGGCWRGRKAR